MINITQTDVFRAGLVVGASTRPIAVGEPQPQPENPPYKIVDKLKFVEKITRAEVIS